MPNTKLDNIDKRIMLFGSSKDIEDTKKLISNYLHSISSKTEGEARILLQKLIDDNKIKADILFDGNGVYSYNTIIRDFKKILKGGTTALTNKLYKFFSLNGTIAHYDKYGWIVTYPTTREIRAMIKKEILPPYWKTDVIRIVSKMRKLISLPEKY